MNIDIDTTTMDIVIDSLLDDDFDQKTMPLDPVLKVGHKFASFEEFEAKLKHYKEAHFVDFFIQDSRTLQCVKNKYPRRVENVCESLKYYSIKYRCIHGGQLRKRKDYLGLRNTSTLKQGCEAMICLNLCENGKNLTISKIIEEHNHPISKEMFKLLPNQRRLTPDLQQVALELLELKADKKLVQERIQQSSGKAITMKDLSNIAAKAKTKEQSFEEIVKNLQTTYQCTIKIKINENNDLKALLLQDQRMHKDFEAYPEILFAESTYKLVDLRIPIFVLLAENGNGKSFIVAIGLLISGDSETLEWFWENFKNLNPASNKTKIVMTDKDLLVRQVIRKVLPGVKLRICLFHALRTFSSEITSNKIGVSLAQFNTLKGYFQKLCYAPTVQAYNYVYEELKKIAPQDVLQYFDENWNVIKEEWCSVSEFSFDVYLNRTNSKVENFNSKLKNAISNFCSLEVFVKDLFFVMKCFRRESDASAAKIFQKTSTEVFASDELKKYFSLLTPYAFDLVRKEFNSVSNYDDSCTTENSCNCKFYVSCNLPCKHIFSFRLANDLPLFDEALVSFRWTKSYFWKNLPLSIEETVYTPPPSFPIDISIEPKEILSYDQKFRKALMITNKIASLISERSQFEDKVLFLEEIYNAWTEGKEVSMTVLGAEESNAIASNGILFYTP